MTAMMVRMMSNPIFSKTKVEQTIELDDVFDIDFTELRSLREAIGEAILQRIKERTEAGEGIASYGESPRIVALKAPYSKAYEKSLDFAAAGKSRGKVNMRLTGDMLELMDIKRQNGNSITIGWTDSTENAKAYNHNVGDTVPRRPFFGISKKELFEIKDQFQDEILEAIEMQKSGKSKEFEKKVEQLLNMIGASDVDAEEG